MLRPARRFNRLLRGKARCEQQRLPGGEKKTLVADPDGGAGSIDHGGARAGEEPQCRHGRSLSADAAPSSDEESAPAGRAAARGARDRRAFPRR